MTDDFCCIVSATVQQSSSSSLLTVVAYPLAFRPSDDGPSALSLDMMTSFLKDVASGLAFLEKNRVVHRDLAARNCLVADDFSIKVCVVCA